MAGKWAKIDFEKCAPALCNGKDGTCAAVDACVHNLLEQEDLYESPMLMSVTMCVGCGDCVRVCPIGAIEIDRK